MMQFYIDKNTELYEKCLAEAQDFDAADISAVVNDLYEAAAQAEHVVGHYLYWYNDAAYEIWKSNLSFAKEQTGTETDMDKEVTRILSELFSCNEVSV